MKAVFIIYSNLIAECDRFHIGGKLGRGGMGVARLCMCLAKNISFLSCGLLSSKRHAGTVMYTCRSGI